MSKIKTAKRSIYLCARKKVCEHFLTKNILAVAVYSRNDFNKAMCTRFEFTHKYEEVGEEERIFDDIG